MGSQCSATRMGQRMETSGRATQDGACLSAEASQRRRRAGAAVYPGRLGISEESELDETFCISYARC